MQDDVVPSVDGLGGDVAVRSVESESIRGERLEDGNNQHDDGWHGESRAYRRDRHRPIRCPHQYGFRQRLTL